MLTLCRLLLAVGRAIVPVACRDDWAREWHAEVASRLPSNRAAAPLVVRRDLLVRCLGALIHAAWLRKEEWSVTVLLQDLRYAIRGLRARTGFAVVAVLVLAVGMGANAAVFSVLHAVVLKPLPYREPDRLVQIWETNPELNWTAATVAPANLFDWRERSESFAGLAYYLGKDGKGASIDDATLIAGGEPERMRAMTVSGNFFQVLGVEPAIGRGLRPADTRPGGPPAVVLSHAFWRRRFGADANAVGRRVDINGVPTEIVGVMAAGFHVPGASADFWQPHRMPEAQLRRMRRAHWFRVVGRLRPGVSLAQARADMRRIAADLERQYPQTNRRMGIGLGPLHDWFVSDVRQAMFLLMGAVGAVLLITCANVASLLLARATSRQREIAIRIALGAGRIRLLRQLMTESLVLAAAAAALGLAAAFAGVALLRRFGPADVPRLDGAAIDGTVLAFVAATTCVTTILFGLAPAWRSARHMTAASLKSAGRTTTGDAAHLRQLLIVGEVALAVVLLAGAGLLLRSFGRLQGVDPGINARNALSFRISLPARYDSDAKSSAFFSETVRRLRSLPGVVAAGGTVRLALEGYRWTGDLFIEGRPEVWGRDLRHKAVTGGYFAAAGLPLLRGRDFSEADSLAAPRVAIVNQTLARRFYGPADPVGSRIAFGRPPNADWVTVIGVVADEKQDSLDADVHPEVYEPQTQDAQDEMALLVRTVPDPWSLLPAIRSEVAAVDSAVALYDIRTLEELIATSLVEERFSAALLSGFAAVALLLAALGLYGVIAFSVTERTREIGVRLALGATRAAVVRMIVWGGLRLVLAGAVLGLAAALAMGRAVASFLFETAPADPLVLATVIAMLALSGIAACYVPAWRASRLDPATTLRAD